VLGRYVRNLWIGLSATGAGTDVRNSGYYVASTGTVKSGNLCKRYIRICSGIDTEMSSCIFSGSKVQGGRFGTLGKPGFRAVRCREAVRVQDFIIDCG